MTRKLKVGISCYPNLGGSGVVATELGKLLAERGHEVHFINHTVPFRLGHFHKDIFYHEVEISDYHVFKYPPYDLTLASKLAQVAQFQGLDILHVHYALPHAICAFLAKEMVGSHLKVVTTLHGTDITILAQDESLKDLIRLGINKSDAITAVSEDLIKETKKYLSIVKPIDMVYNFVDKRVYYPMDVDKLRCEFAEKEEKVVIHISNFRPVKRVTDVIDIFDKINDQVKSRLLLVGEGPDLSKIMTKVKDMGLSERVCFCGKQDDVAQIVSMADLMILPSEKESFGLVALEAMACGVPTVGSVAGGIPELITHGETGYLAQIGDVEQMAQYAITLLQDDELHERFSKACIERARTVFCDQIIVKQYEDIYFRVLDEQTDQA
ncbi:MAG: N-acetyl-alpha-D-glucosaminyl L-malate synthase BshA [Paenibacillus sp. RIFOXYA1_FULL_44_5]|nr:MAG: N-acetyl-alpha-D-glucosaminyl L-malate synthase BshA [Paenibacillus sp. RIFOXYA1_FULL_44_5]